MVSVMKETSGSDAPPIQEVDATTLSELRESVTALANEVAELAARRARIVGDAAAGAAETGVDELRRGIRKQPVVALAVAVAAGALLALAVVPRANRRASRWERWTPNVTRADLYDIADNIQRSVSRAAGAAAAPVTPAFERLVEALSRADTSAMNSIIERMGGWFQKVQDKSKEKMR